MMAFGWILALALAAAATSEPTRKSKLALWPAHGWIEPPAGSTLVETLLPRLLPDGRPLFWRSHLYKLAAPTAEGFEFFIELQRSDGAYVTCAGDTEGIEFCRSRFLIAPPIEDL